MSQSAAEALIIIIMIIVFLDYSSLRLYFQFFYSSTYKNYSFLLFQIIGPPNRLALDSERFLNLHLWVQYVLFFN